MNEGNLLAESFFRGFINNTNNYMKRKLIYLCRFFYPKSICIRGGIDKWSHLLCSHRHRFHKHLTESTGPHLDKKRTVTQRYNRVILCCSSKLSLAVGSTYGQLPWQNPIFKKLPFKLCIYIPVSGHLQLRGCRLTEASTVFRRFDSCTIAYIFWTEHYLLLKRD